MQYVRFLLSQDNTHEFDPQARAWLVEEAKAGEPEAMLLLGNLYAKGVGVSQSYRQALTWFKSAVTTSPDDVNIVNEVAWTLAVTHLEPLRKPSYALEIMDRAMTARRSGAERIRRISTPGPRHMRPTATSRAQSRCSSRRSTPPATRKSPTWSKCCRQHLDAFQRGETVIDPVP